MFLFAVTLLFILLLYKKCITQTQESLKQKVFNFDERYTKIDFNVFSSYFNGFVGEMIFHLMP